MKHSFILSVFLLSSVFLHGQTRSFEHLDVAVTLGTTGLGIDLATPILPWLDVRAGFSAIPKILSDNQLNMIETTPEKGETQSRFDRISETFEALTGYKLQSEVTMNGRTNFWNANVMLDFKPFNDKRWHLTAGVYFGPSEIATSKNAPECMSTLLSIGTYNNYYNKLNDPAVTSGEVPFFSFRGLEIYLFGDELYIEYGDIGIFKKSDLIDKLRENGSISAHLGDRSNGEPYNMVPNEEGIISSTIKVNSIKPYVGFGYEGQISKKSDKYLINFDCGIMLWGGKPHFIMHDGTDLTYEINNYNSQIAGYCGTLKRLPVYPVVNFRFIRRIDLNKK